MSISIPKHPDVAVAHQVSHLIGGRSTPSQSGETFANTAPAHNSPAGDIALGGEADVALAVTAAEQALAKSEYATWPKKDRSALLHRIADELEAHRYELAVLEAYDTGKPLSETSTGDIPRAIANFRFFAELLLHEPDQAYSDQWQVTHLGGREPIGIVGLITPWNLPLYLTTWKLAPALACGNAVVIKPAELTPLTAARLGELCLQAGVPEGLVNVVQGHGPDSAGEALVRHPQVRAISFTGETVTGRTIMATAAPHLKKLSFELGGKGASVVTADADLSRAAPIVAKAAFRNQGQICLAGSRLIVAEAVVGEFLERLQAEVQGIKLGDPLDEATTMGALICRDHRDKVASMVTAAKARQAGEILCGGQIPQGLGDGSYYEPTVIAGVDQQDPLIQQELFGPVLTVQTFGKEEEAIAMLNGTEYGLSCSIWSRDANQANRLARQAKMGLVWVNTWFLRDLHTAFGGFKSSGVGREGGRYSLDFFSEQKTISWQYS